jgi:hypothetical protein
MFKGVATDRPWQQHTTMTTQLWLRRPVRLFPLSDLWVTQDTLSLLSLIGPDTSACGDPYPHVIEWRREFYLEDGHHRALRAAVNGTRTIR